MSGLIALIFGLCFVRAYVGLWAFRIDAPDAFSLFDGAWRIMHGQTPHVDFYTALGPLTYLITGAGMALAGGYANGLAYGQALFGAIAGIWAYRLARSRLRDVPAILASLTIVLLAITPTIVGDPINAITPGTTYNRYGYALFALVLIEAVRPNRDRPRHGEFWGGFSTGAALALGLFLKISVFLGAAFMVAALVPIRPQDRQRWLGVAAGMGATSFVFLAYLRFDLAAILRDLAIAGHAKHLSYGGYLIYDLLFCALPFLICMMVLSRSSGSSSDRRAMILAAVGACLAGYFAIFTSWQSFSMPLNTIMAILLIDRLIEQSSLGETLRPPPLWALLVLSFMILSTGYSDARTLEFTLARKLGNNPEQQQLASFTAPVLSGFTTLQADFVAVVNDGFALLNQHRRASDTVFTLDFTNLFSYLIGADPPSGGATWLQYTNNFDERGPSAERLFGAPAW